MNDSPQAQTSEILCKPNAGTKSTVDPRFITGTRNALSSWLLTSGPTPFCLCKPFSCKACPGIAHSCRLFHLSNPKPGHTTGGSGRDARRSVGAGSGRSGRRQNCSPRRQESLAPSKASRTSRLNDSSEARKSEILWKPMEKQSPRLTR